MILLGKKWVIKNMEKVKLKDIALIYNGNSINAKEKSEKYTLKVDGRNYIGTKDIDYDGAVTYNTGVIIPYSDTKFRIAPANCIFVCSEGGSAGKKTAHITQEVCFGNKLYAIVNDKNLFVSKYVYYYTRYREFFEQFKSLMSGIIGGVSSKKFGEIEIPLPSLQEQQSVVDKIEELFSKLDKSAEELNKIKEQLKIYRQAVLKEAFEGRWKYGDRMVVNIDSVDKSLTGELPELPKEWKYVHLSKLGELSRGKSKHRPRNDKKLFEDGKYPFVQTGDVKAANKYLTTYSTMYGDFGLAQSKLWKKGTLCITIAANIAETCILGIDACFPDSVVGFDPQEGLVNKDYVRYFIEASKIRLWAFAPATAQKNINLTTLENLIIPYCDIDEQKYIVTEIESRLSVCNKIEQTVNESLQKSESLRQSILKQAFEGKLV